MNTELTLDFRTMHEWNEWAKSNKANFSKLTENALSKILTNGFEVPLMGIKLPANEIQINKENLRESIQHSGLNSRRRAGLYAIELALENLPQKNRLSPRILATESRGGLARVLSYKFQYFLGTESLSNQENINSEFPVRHLNIEKNDLPENSFDVIYNSDNLEYVGDVNSALQGFFNVLRPGGVLISTFRFQPNFESTVNFEENTEVFNDNANIKFDSSITNKKSVNKFIRRIFGWDFLNEFLKIGFEDVKLTFLLSSRYGILGSTNPGIFVLTATKSREIPSVYKRSTLICAGNLKPIPPKRIIGMIGLPRSGTTLLASLFAVHSDINAVYEPWNITKNQITDNVCSENFYSVFPENYESGKDILFIKETTTEPVFFTRLRRVVNSNSINLYPNCIFLFRNPAHVYLSEIEARKTWWGIDKKISDLEAFDMWFIKTMRSIIKMLNYAEETNGILVSYEYIVSNPVEAIDGLMTAINIPVDTKQYEFHNHLKLNKVNGDPKLKNNLVKIDSIRATKNQVQINDFNLILSQSRYSKDFKELSLFIDSIISKKVFSIKDLNNEIKFSLAPYMPI
jgi:SAM-dependent methyltransferase